MAISYIFMTFCFLKTLISTRIISIISIGRRTERGVAFDENEEEEIE